MDVGVINNSWTIGKGFGYIRDYDGKLKYREHYFGVILEGNNTIGHNTNIDLGRWRDTRIGYGTILDSLVHVGHNAIIEGECLVVAGTIIGGSANIGNKSYLGMNSSIKDHVKIGNHVIVGAGSVVINDIPDYDIVAGNPAKSIKDRVKLSKEERYNMVGY